MDGQTIGVALSILGGIATALGMYLRSQGSVKLKDAETRARESEGKIKQMELEHNARIEELRADADMRAILREQISLSEKERQTQRESSEQQRQATEQQRRINQEQFDNFMKTLEVQRQEAAAQYRLMRNIQKDSDLSVTNLSNDVKGVQRELKVVAQNVNDSKKEILTKLNSLTLPSIPNGTNPKSPNEPPISIG